MSNNINDLFHFRSQKRTQQQSTGAHDRSLRGISSAAAAVSLSRVCVCVCLLLSVFITFLVCVDAFSSFYKNLLCSFFSSLFCSSFKYMLADEFRPNGITTATQHTRNIRYPCTHTHRPGSDRVRYTFYFAPFCLHSKCSLRVRVCVSMFTCVCAPSIFNGISVAVSEPYLFNFGDHKTYCYIFFFFVCFCLVCNVSV